MGFPYGADEDAAYIIAWLELNKLNGLKILVNSIKFIDNKYNGIVNLNNKEFIIDLNNASILMKGPGLIDYLKSQLKNKRRIEMIINNCSDPLCFIPLLYKNSIDVPYSTLIYNYKKENILCSINKNKLIISKQNRVKNIFKNQAKITMSNNYEYLRLKDIKQKITNDTIQENLSKSIKPNIYLWQTIEKIACRTFVAESDESRAKGAGGVNDND